MDQPIDDNVIFAGTCTELQHKMWIPLLPQTKALFNDIEHNKGIFVGQRYGHVVIHNPARKLETIVGGGSAVMRGVAIFNYLAAIHCQYKRYKVKQVYNSAFALEIMLEMTVYQKVAEITSARHGSRMNRNDIDIERLFGTIWDHMLTMSNLKVYAADVGRACFWHCGPGSCDTPFFTGLHTLNYAKNHDYTINTKVLAGVLRKSLSRRA